MNLEELAMNRALQERYVEQADDLSLKLKVFEVLDLANSFAVGLSREFSESLEQKQSLALRCCFFFLNQLGDRRLKRADSLPASERDSDFQKIKDDFELVYRFAQNPEDLETYFFKCDKERIFEVAVFVALSFMGGNPAIERVVEGAEKNRLQCFELMMLALSRSR